MEALNQVLAHVHDRGDVAAAVAVVGGTPDGDDRLVIKVPLSLHLSTLCLLECGSPDVPCNLR